MNLRRKKVRFFATVSFVSCQQGDQTTVFSTGTRGRSSNLQGRPKSDTAYREIKGSYSPSEGRATAISFALHCHSVCSFFFCFSRIGVLERRESCSPLSTPVPKQSFSFWKCLKTYGLPRVNILMLLLDRVDHYSAIIWFWRGICTDFCRLWHMPMTRHKPSTIRKPHSCADNERPGQNEWQKEV